MKVAPAGTGPAEDNHLEEGKPPAVADNHPAEAGNLPAEASNLPVVGDSSHIAEGSRPAVETNRARKHHSAGLGKRQPHDCPTMESS